ncbi:tyrosine-type recombinase/integrase [Vibrio navarrensis]|uniref:tyrosine-type recombinase/integrase n=1 Tax=Vibrio navarrensis TaxID=29495 RepID=UPI0018DE9E1E|nr:tyrosine-type recombinase/integrase [Vibrio navarrensis]MBH9740024.1 hypothetical protein [Vibrio navarrensis]
MSKSMVVTPSHFNLTELKPQTGLDLKTVPHLDDVERLWAVRKKALKRFSITLPNLTAHIDPASENYGQIMLRLVEFDNDRLGLSENSIKALVNSINQWVKFCSSIGVYSLPINEELLILYLKKMDLERKKISTIKQFVSQMSNLCKIAAIEDVARRNSVTSILSSLQKDRVEITDSTYSELQASPLQRHHMKAMIPVLAHESQHICCLRDCSFLCIAYGTLIRSAEIRMLKRKQLEIRGSDVLIKRIVSKTDINPLPKLVTGKMALVIIKYLGYFDDCMNTFDRYQDYYIFSELSRGWRFKNPETPMARSSVVELFRRCHRVLKIGGKPWTAHSARVGGLIDGYNEGFTEAELVKLGDWKSSTMVYKYLRNLASNEAPNVKLHF